MQLQIRFVIVLCLATAVAHSQKFPIPVLNPGDPAPPLRTQSWIKGKPVNKFEKGKIYLVEFWATWCVPCRAEMPYLSALARKYKNNITVISIDIKETKKTTLNQVKTFVANMGQQMDYNVAIADNDYMESKWLNPAGAMGIPNTFIVGRDGKLAWIGHPCELETILPQILNNTWDINESSAKRNLKFHLMSLEDSLSDELEFAPDGSLRGESWIRDSALLLIDERAKAVPLIKYTPRIAFRTFSILAKSDMKKACDYGRKVLVTSTYENPAGYLIKGAIEELAKQIDLTSEIYQLGIEAIQVEINDALSCYPEIRSLYKQYYKMAEWYLCIGDKSKAIEAQEKAIEDMKGRSNYLAKDLAQYEDRLKQYKEM